MVPVVVYVGLQLLATPSDQVQVVLTSKGQPLGQVRLPDGLTMVILVMHTAVTVAVTVLEIIVPT